MLAKKLMMATAAKPQLFVDSVFSTYLYTGNGSTQTINNGIDLAGEGGLVWIKARSGTNGHGLFDTQRGSLIILRSNTTGSEFPATASVTGFNADGFVLGGGSDTNASPTTYASWTFRRAPKFFDVVTYTGNGTSNRQISHDLGAEPGFITTKSTSTTGDWNSYHRSATGDLVLNSTAAQTGSRAIVTAADSSTFTVSGVANTNGVSYVAYLWAHDHTNNGIVQCGSFTTDGSGNATVNHGWTAGVQYVTLKAVTTTSEWETFDTARTAAWSSSDARIRPNFNSAEDSVNRISASGTSLSFSGLSASQTYIYIFIVAPTP